MRSAAFSCTGSVATRFQPRKTLIAYVVFEGDNSWGELKIVLNRRLASLLFLALAPALCGQTALTQDQKEHFLETAKVVSVRDLSIGITNSHRATLNDGSITHDAHVQDVNERKARADTPRGTELNFVDSYKFNIAAYRLDRLLGLGMIPPSVERKVAGKPSAVTWWVDDVLMMEKERYLKKTNPPDRASWNDQMFNLRIFNQLVYNTDPNLGNVLIDKNWHVWAIDFTRAFRWHKQLEKPDALGKIDRGVWDRLRALEPQEVRETMRGVLSKSEISGLLARREKLIELFEKLIAARGEAQVLCTLPPRS